MAVQGPHELARGRVPDFDGPIAGSGNDVLLVEVDDVDGGAMTDLKTTNSCNEINKIVIFVTEELRKRSTYKDVITSGKGPDFE